MKETANFGLKKPEENEFYDVNVQNDNMDAVDKVLQEFKDGTQQVGDSARLGGKDADEYLTKRGGELKSTENTVLKLNAITGSSLVALQEFLADDVSYGHLGFDGVNSPIFRATDSNYYKLLHTGNKPSGSYTGNGSATERTIAIGGIGQNIKIRSTGETLNTFIVDVNGYFGVANNTFVHGLDAFITYEGNLCVRADSTLFNISGMTYYYEKL